MLRPRDGARRRKLLNLHRAEAGEDLRCAARRAMSLVQRTKPLLARGMSIEGDRAPDALQIR